eukprot:1155926-Pelagomonas_calceolata.AAC.2
MSSCQSSTGLPAQAGILLGSLQLSTACRQVDSRILGLLGMQHGFGGAAECIAGPGPYCQCASARFSEGRAAL